MFLEWLGRPAAKYVLMLLLGALVLLFVIYGMQSPAPEKKAADAAPAAAPIVAEPSAPKKILDNARDRIRQSQQHELDNLKQAQDLVNQPAGQPSQ